MEHKSRSALQMMQQKPLPNGGTSSALPRQGEKEEEGRAYELLVSPTLSFTSQLGDEDEDRTFSPSSSPRRMNQKELLEDQTDQLQAPEDPASFEYCLTLVERRLEERRQVGRGGERRSGTVRSMRSIFRFPPNLVGVGINPNAYEPEIVSIGPHHRGKVHLLEFEELKWSFLARFLTWSNNLRYYLRMMSKLEMITRDCYSDASLMSSHDFIEMMLLDSCFILDLLLRLTHSGDAINDDDPIFTRPWLIPVLIKDLLKLENQIPFFVLDMLFKSDKGYRDHMIALKIEHQIDPLPLLALRVFNLAFPRRLDILEGFRDYKAKHLLDLFHSSLLPSSFRVINCDHPGEYRPSAQSIQCVTQLRPSGIKFKPLKVDCFLDIRFQNRVLQIPPITINDFTSTMIINCVALEQCQENITKYITDYVSFMNCLISQPRDVAFLCVDGIISRFSQDDLSVADLFNNLGKGLVFNIRNSYLARQFREVESYYSSNWATFLRTYFSSPWAFISVVSAILLLLLTMIQSIMAVISHKS